MGLLTKLKSLLGLGDDRSGIRRTESGVTIEREPGESAEPDADAERAVEGEEESVAAGGAGTGVSTEEGTATPAEESDTTAGTEADAEPAEAAEPSHESAEEPESTPEATGEAEAEASEDAGESAGEGEPLEEVKGIGPAYAEKLRDAGVPDAAALAEADADRLADETGLSEKRISGWIERVRAR